MSAGAQGDPDEHSSRVGDVTEWPIVFRGTDIIRFLAAMYEETFHNFYPSLVTISIHRSSNAAQRLKKIVATKLAILFQQPRQPKAKRDMDEQRIIRPSLHVLTGGRKYLNAAERRRFHKATRLASKETRLFCLTLIWSGGRISEVLALVPSAIDLDAGVAALETLKKRRRGVIRQVPLPASLLRDLDAVFCLRTAQRDPLQANRRLWPWSRVTAWRHVKSLMRVAAIPHDAAMPKGLRHTFGVVAFQAVPPHMVQRWLGHASLRTTAIYGDVCGPEERAFASRIWRTW